MAVAVSAFSAFLPHEMAIVAIRNVSADKNNFFMLLILIVLFMIFD